MRIASSPTLRIATGLLLAALLSIVGYQVFRRWISHGPEALLERADDLSWLIHKRQSKSAQIYIDRAETLPALGCHQGNAASEPVHVADGSSIPIASHDPIADLQLTPDLVWHQFTLSRGTPRQLNRSRRLQTLAL
jgi:hypothetical protein